MIRDFEVNFVVADSLLALETYQKIFDIDVIEMSNFPQGNNEVIFKLFDMKLHMLDENPEYGLIAPSEEGHATFWYNVTVPNIMQTHHNALRQGCIELQPVTPMMDFGVSNSLFRDPFGYLWMLHQNHADYTHEEEPNTYADFF